MSVDGGQVRGSSGVVGPGWVQGLGSHAEYCQGLRWGALCPCLSQRKNAGDGTEKAVHRALPPGQMG